MRLDLDETALLKRITGRLKKVQFDLDQQVIKDSNYFAPLDTGDLQDTVLSSELGLIVWASVYASRQYYEDNNKSLDKNPNASMLWFEVAKAKNINDWERLANDRYNG